MPNARSLTSSSGVTPALLAYVLLSAWTALAVNMHATMAPHVDAARVGPVVLGVWVFSRFLCSFAVVPLASRVRDHGARQLVQGVSLALMELGTVLLTCAANGWIGTTALLVAGAALAGVGAELGGLLWLELLARGSFARARVLIVADMAVKACVAMFVAIPYGLSFILCLVLPVVCALGYVRALKDDATTPGPDAGGPGARYRLTLRTALPVAAGVTLLYFGSHFLQDGLAGSVLDDGLGGAAPWADAVGRWLALAVLLLLLGRASDMSFEALFSGAALLAILGFLALPLDMPPQSLFAFRALTIAACILTNKAMNLVVVSIAGHANMSALRVVALGDALLLAGHSLGIVAGTALSGDLAHGYSAAAYYPIAAACVVLLAFSGMWLLRDGNINAFIWARSRQEGEGELPSGAQSGAAESAANDAALSPFALEYGLTPREAEVAALLLEGRSIPFVAEALNVSRSTVKTHVDRIYAKCGVHSRQDLITLARS